MIATKSLHARTIKSNIEEIELIQILIDEYESKTIEKPKGMNPVEMIHYILLRLVNHINLKTSNRIKLDNWYKGKIK